MRDLLPATSPTEPDPLRRLLEWHGERRSLALATVAETWGSAPCPVGSHLVIDAEGHFEGSVSGGCVEGAVLAEAAEMLGGGGGPRLLEFGVGDATAWSAGLSCGGRIRVAVAPVGDETAATVAALLAAREANAPFATVADLRTGTLRPLSPGDGLASAADAERPRLLEDGVRALLVALHRPAVEIVVIGAVHVAQVLAGMARLAGRRLRIVDPRTAFATPERFGGLDLTAEWPQEAFEARPLHPRAALVALTHDPKIDDPAIRAALSAGAFYLGALGSRRTHAARRDRLLAAGVTAQEVARIRGPIGLPIGAEGPAEIALSILAEIVAAERRADAGWPLRA